MTATRFSSLLAAAGVLLFVLVDTMLRVATSANRGVWAMSVEKATRNYVKRAAGDVYVITGPVYVPSIGQTPSIGAGQVRVSKYLFKLVYDESRHRAWAYWHENSDATGASKPISYADLVERTGINFLPDVKPSD